MQYIALRIELHSRSKEIQSACINKPCTVVWREGVSRTGVTPLYWACATGQNQTALLLINAGADVNALSTRNDGEQLSSLYRAIKLGHTEVVKALLEKIADPNIGDASPLYWACATGHTQTALLLINAGADVNAFATNNDGKKLSSLYRAANLGDTEVVRALLEKGADPNFGDASPLTHAKNEEISKLMKIRNTV